MRLDKLTVKAQEALEAAGGIAKEFDTIAIDDGIAMGHGGMLYSLPSRDLIADFVSGTDHIDLSSIDANAAMAGDQAFTKLLASSTAFTAAGQLRFGGGVLYGNTDTDTAAEFSIALSGITRISLTDFIL